MSGVPARPSMVDMTTLDDTRSLDLLVERAFNDFAAAMTLPLVRLGDRLGLYRGIHALGSCTSAELAAHCGAPEPIVHEWLANQAAAGYVTVDPDAEVFSLTADQVAVFVDEDSGACLLPAFQLAAAYVRSEPSLAAALKGAEAYPWGDHDPELFTAVERFYRPAYTASLVPEWIAALDGVADLLTDGALVADVGCGHGLSTVLMVAAFPASRFVGLDDHAESIESARRLAAAEGVSDRVAFEVRPARELEGRYDLVTVLDAFHDMGAPHEVAAVLRAALTERGVCMVVEPLAGDRLHDNLTPLGRIYYAASTLACTPSALSQDDGRPLGAQAGPARLVEALEAGGFGSVRVVATTPFNLVLEARP